MGIELVQVGYRVLKMTGRTKLIDLQDFLGVKEVDESNRRDESQKKDDGKSLLLHLWAF